MYDIRPEFYDLLDTMTLGEKKYLMQYLGKIIEEEENTPKTYLEENWAEIKRLIKIIDLTPYIDDQIELAEIWGLCEEMIGSGELSEEDWSVREKILYEIIEEEYFDHYGLSDPIRDLRHALILTKEEELLYADMVFERGSGYMKKEAAKIYLKNGKPEQYYAYREKCLGKDGSVYWELIDYYKDFDSEKAFELAELAMKKSRENLTEIVIFLLQDAKEKDDHIKYKKLMKSAKLRQSVNYSVVLEIMGEG